MILSTVSRERLSRLLFLLGAVPIYFLTILIAVVSVRRSATPSFRARLVWGSTPILNNKYWARAMSAVGYHSATYVTSYFPTINKRGDFDLVLDERFRFVPRLIGRVFAFWESLLRFDVFFISFDGYFLGGTPLWRLESHFLRLAGKKVVVVPYGSDSYVYRNVRSVSLIHGLMLSFPRFARNQDQIASRVAHWCRHADCVIPGIMGPDGFGRWDALLPSTLCIDTDLWTPSVRRSEADGIAETVVIGHAPNHRGFKGTEFIIDAVKRLQAEKLKVEIRLIEKVQNDELRRVFREDIDIVVDQLICTGHGLNALEALASGLPVISNLEHREYVEAFRRWSYLGECPIVSASPETVTHCLRALVTRPDLRRRLGIAGRQYAEKYHSFAAAQYLFTAVLDFLYGRRGTLLDLYHPLTGALPNSEAKVDNPLVENRIVD